MALNIKLKLQKKIMIIMMKKIKRVLPSASTFYLLPSLSPLPVRRDTHFTSDYEDWSNSPPFITTNHINHYGCAFLICFLGEIETRPKENPFWSCLLFAVCCWIDWERLTKKKEEEGKPNTKNQIPKPNLGQTQNNTKANKVNPLFFSFFFIIHFIVSFISFYHLIQINLKTFTLISMNHFIQFILIFFLISLYFMKILIQKPKQKQN